MTGGIGMKLLGRNSFQAVAALALLLLANFPARADDGEDSVFCAWAQQVAAGTALTANVVTQTVFDDFVKSKASYSPLTVQQYWSNPVAGSDGMARVVSCKMSTAERINHAHQADSLDGAPAAAGGTRGPSCRHCCSPCVEVQCAPCFRSCSVRRSEVKETHNARVP